MKIVLWVEPRVIGAGSKSSVEQVEIDRAAVPNAVEDTDHLPDGDDNVEQQVDGAREVARYSADVGG